jgi:hypothetical protein
MRVARSRRGPRPPALVRSSASEAFGRGAARGKGELDPQGMLNLGVLIDPKVDELAHDIEVLMLPW